MSNGFENVDSPKPEAAIGYAVLAIGAQASSTAQAPEDEKVSLSVVQKAAFAGMLEKQDLYTVQIFLLLSFYMLVAGRKDAVFMYLGIAARATLVIKLGTRDPSLLAYPDLCAER